MALTELFGSREMWMTAEGVAGRRLFVCNESEVERTCPSIGETWPGKNYLYVQNVHWQAITPSKMRVEVNYTSRQVTKPVESLDFSAEALETTYGRVWYSDGESCSQREAVLYPEIEHTASFTTPFLNKGLIYDLVGCINMFPFLLAGPERVLFAGCRARTEYTNLNEMAWRVEYRFIFRGISWNMIWRQDQAKWDYLLPTLYNTANLGLLMM